MSLQQALLTHVPLAKKRAELEKVIARESWAILWPHLEYPLTPRQKDQVISSRQIYYSTQDQLRRLS